MATTVQPGRTRRVVRRRARPALDAAYDVALSELPPEIRPLVRRYAETMAEGQQIRSDLTMAKVPYPALKWTDIDAIARALAF
jgi:hypothetical protein